MPGCLYSSEHILFRPAMMELKLPGLHLTTPADRPWLWVAKEVTSTLTIADHLIENEGMVIQHDDDDQWRTSQKLVKLCVSEVPLSL